jgi:tetratricopeptide (TPR) repeat protein
MASSAVEDPAVTLASLVERALGAQLHDNAAFLAERLVSIAPTEVNRHLLALAYVRGGNAQQAAATLKTASSPQNRYLLAKCYTDVENYGEAEDALMKGGLSIATPAALRPMLFENPNVIPNGAAGVYLLALCAQKTDRLERAVELYKLSLELDPSMFCSYQALCKLGRAPQPHLVYGYPEPGFVVMNAAGSVAAAGKGGGAGVAHDENAHVLQSHRKKNRGGSRGGAPPDSAEAAFAAALDANRPSPMAPTTPAMKFFIATPQTAGGGGGGGPASAALASAARAGGGVGGVSGIAGISGIHQQDAAYLTTTSIGSDTGLALFSGGSSGGSGQAKGKSKRKVRTSSSSGEGAAAPQQGGLMNIDEAPTSEEEEEEEDEATETSDNVLTGLSAMGHQDDEDNDNVAANMSLAAPATPPAVLLGGSGAATGIAAIGTAPAMMMPLLNSGGSEPIAAQLAFYSNPPNSSGGAAGGAGQSQLGAGVSGLLDASPIAGGAGGAIAEPSPIAQQLTFISSAGGPGKGKAKGAINNTMGSAISGVASVTGGGGPSVSAINSFSSAISGVVDVTSAGIGASDVDTVARRLNSGLLAFNSAPEYRAPSGAAAPPSSGAVSVGPRRGQLLFDTPAEETPVAAVGAAGHGIGRPAAASQQILSGVRDAPAAAAGHHGFFHPPLHPPYHHHHHVVKAPVPNLAHGGAAGAPVHQVAISSGPDAALLASAAASSPTLRLLGTFAAAYYGLWVRYDLQWVTKAIALLPSEVHRESAFAQAILGRAYAEAAKYSQACACFEKIRNAGPLFTPAGSQSSKLTCVGGGPTYLDCADVHSTVLWQLKQGHKLEALAAACFATDRKNPVSLVVAANSASLKRDHAGALQYLARAISVDPTYTYAHTLAGHEHLTLGDLERAKVSFRAALRYDPRHYNALYGFGSAFLREEKLALAEQYFMAAMAINRTSAWLHCSLGQTLSAQKRYSEALQALNTASALSPGLTQASYQRALVYLAMGDDASAERALLAVLELAPKEPTVLIQLGKVCKAQGKKQEALSYLHAALANTRGDKDIGIVKHLINGLSEGEGGEGNGDDEAEDDTIF